MNWRKGFAAHEIGEFELGESETLLLYSDGLSEAADAKGEELGVDGLEKLLAGAAGMSATEAGNTILEAVESFGQGGEVDDRTFLILKARSASDDPTS